MPRRHENASYVLFPKGDCGHRGHKRGIYASAQAHDNVPASVLSHVGACAEHKCLQDLLCLFHRFRHGMADFRFRRLFRNRPQVYCPDIEVSGPFCLPPPWVMEARHFYGINVEVHDDKVLFKGPAARDYAAPFVNDHAPAVKDQLVLAADSVVVCDYDLVIPGPGDEHLLPYPGLADVIGRGVYVYDDLGSGKALRPCRPFRVPDVLAYLDSYGNPAQYEVQGSGAGLEIPLLVKDPVVGQVHLVIYAGDFAVVDYGGRGVYVSLPVNEACYRRYAPYLFREGRERLQVVVDETRLQEQVFRRVAGKGKFGE